MRLTGLTGPLDRHRYGSRKKGRRTRTVSLIKGRQGRPEKHLQFSARSVPLPRVTSKYLSELKLSVALGEGNNRAVPKKMFLTEAQAEQIVREDLEQYFLTFDTDNREQFLTAYANDASFSMILFDPHNPHNSHNPNNLNEYFTDDRNVRRIDTNETKKLLTHGRWPIVKFLYKMSQTYHY